MPNPRPSYRTMKANLSAPFIHRPVMTTVVMAALLVFGMVAYFTLPVSELPNVDFPTVNVSGEPAGRGPRDHGLVGGYTPGTPVQYHRWPHLHEFTSTTGNTNITLQFDLSRNIDAAAEDVQTAISQASASCRSTCRRRQPCAR